MIREPAGRRVGWLLLAVGTIMAGMAIWAVAGRGLRVSILGLSISARDPLRPGVAAILALVIGCTLLLRGRSLRAGLERARRALTRLERLALRAAPGFALAAAVLVLAIGVRFGVRAAGGADPFGYVSQAQLWLSGSLHVRQDIAGTLPWPNPDRSMTPLGFRPAANHTAVPTYAPGLPLLMAGAQVLAGACGPFLVPVFSGSLLVLLTYVLGARVGGPVVGGAAAVSVAASPTLVYMTLWTMSDVPAAVCWTASLVVASRAGRGASAVSGALAGLAILIRPNLVPLTLIPLALTAWSRTGRNESTRASRVLSFAAASIPFALAVAWVNARLYGSPFESGYSRLGSMYAWEHVAPNLARYPAWLWETATPLVFVFPAAALLGRARAGDPPLRALLLVFVLAVFACYLGYRPFDDWWYLRFLLPAFPAIFVLAADTVWFGLARLGTTARLVGLSVFAATLALHGARTTLARDLLDIGRGEQKYADTGRFVASHLPVDAVVIAMQHSGNVRLYSGRTILRYDQLPGDWLDRAVEHLRTQGRPVYFLLEDWEVPDVRRRFAGERTIDVLAGPALARHYERDVALYATGKEPEVIPSVIPATTGCAFDAGAPRTRLP